MKEDGGVGMNRSIDQGRHYRGEIDEFLSVGFIEKWLFVDEGDYLPTCNIKSW